MTDAGSSSHFSFRFIKVYELPGKTLVCMVHDEKRGFDCVANEASMRQSDERVRSYISIRDGINLSEIFGIFLSVNIGRLAASDFLLYMKKVLENFDDGFSMDLCVSYMVLNTI